MPRSGDQRNIQQKGADVEVISGKRVFKIERKRTRSMSKKDTDMAMIPNNKQNNKSPAMKRKASVKEKTSEVVKRKVTTDKKVIDPCFKNVLAKELAQEAVNVSRRVIINDNAVALQGDGIEVMVGMEEYDKIVGPD